MLDYHTWSIGCQTCGPQWVVTMNTEDETVAISWVREHRSVLLHADGTYQIEEGE